MASSFHFSAPLWSSLAKFGARAEQYCHPTLKTWLMKLGRTPVPLTQADREPLIVNNQEALRYGSPEELDRRGGHFEEEKLNIFSIPVDPVCAEF